MSATPELADRIRSVRRAILRQMPLNERIARLQLQARSNRVESPIQPSFPGPDRVRPATQPCHPGENAPPVRIVRLEPSSR